MKTLYSLLLCLLPLLTWAEEPTGAGAGAIEKRKTVTKLFDVDANDALVVDNQFGQVSVELWDKPEIRVQIVITANADTDERAQALLDAVTIDDKRAGNQITVRTNVTSGNQSNWSFRSAKTGSQRVGVRIDYVVSMPRQNALTVRNRFGNTAIPTFQAPLTVYNRYGNFSAEDLTGRQNNIDVAFGRADIGSMDQGKLDVQYSTLELAKANTLTLNNKFGEMTINNVGRLNADISYSGARIGVLRESGNIKLNFCGKFWISELPKTADNLDIQASYSPVTLPLAEGADCNFDVTVTYGNFNYVSGSTMQFISHPDEKKDNYGARQTKQYVGKVGRGSGVKVRIISKFGNVSFK